jgi:hypothetical protein
VNDAHIEQTMKTKLLLSLALVLNGGLFGCSTVIHHPIDASKQTPTSTTNKSVIPLSASIALLDSPFNNEIYVFVNTNYYFHVVISNNSDKPQNLIKETCSLGYQALSFELVDEDGNKCIIRRNPVAWVDNGLTWWILKPGEHYVQDVCFGEITQGHAGWSGFPDLKYRGGTLKVKMNAVFELNTGTLKGRLPVFTNGLPGVQTISLWNGRIESKPITCRIWEQ